MTKDKQIEEMAKVIDKSPWKLEQDFTGCHINSSKISESLYNAGYRKQSEVAMEIIGEILLNHTPDIDGFFTMRESELAELKKKYTEDTNG